jgi:tetratricopeptide (TPR) repeat protein
MVGSATGCPNEDTIQRFLAGQLEGDQRDQVAAHVADCRDCSEDVTVAARIARVPPAVDPGGTPRARERVGRFELHERLGLGGMGTVFRARAVDSGEWVALKRVRMEHPALIEALRREIQALKRIDHPGVVRVLDQDTTQGLPWYAMELLEGRTLYDDIAALHATLAGPERRFADFRPFLVVIRRLCETLAFLHGEGVVHRDLTPRNVVVRPDGAPVLVDFGIATQFPAPGREAVDLDRPRAGTPVFSAPEQHFRNVVDARADIYALGCILSYAFTSRTPAHPKNRTTLRVDEPGTTDSSIRRPSEFVREFPPALEEVILRMMARNPRERLGYATDLARALDLAGVEAPPPEWRKPVRSYVYRPAMFGRERPLERLAALVDRTRQEGGGLALVSGESGVGKTRLALEVAALARGRGLNVISGACVNVSGGAQGSTGAPEALHLFRPLVQAMLDHCRYRGPDEMRAIFGSETADLALAFPAVGDLAPSDPRLPTDLPADESRFRVISALSQVLARFAQRTPLLLVFDDLQWADLFSLNILESFATGLLAVHPILIVGTYRSEELDSRLIRMLRAVADESIDLGRLAPRDVDTMIGDILALPDPPLDLVRFLARESEGNPFFIAEYLRVAVEEGWLSRDEVGTWRMASKGAVALLRAEPLATPPSLFEVLGRRLAGLGPAAQHMCGLAAVAGRELDADLLRTALGATQDELLDTLNELLVRHVLETDGTVGLRFAHDKLREAAYARLDRGSLVSHHRTVALAMEAYAVGAKGRFDAQLAHHWRTADNPAREGPYRLAAGEQAFRVGAYHEAILHLERALALLPPGTPAATMARLQRHVAEAHFGVGDMPSSRRGLAAAARHAGLPAPATAGGRVALIAADVVASIAVNVTRPILQPILARRRGEMTEAASCYERLAHLLYFENETLGVVSSSLRALRAASQLGPSPEFARILANLSLSVGLVPMRLLARFLARHARRVANQISDEAALAWVTQLDGVYSAGIGDWTPAVASLEEALAAWQRIGHRRRWEESLTLLGMALYHSGDRARAAGLRRELLAAGRESRSPQTIGWALIGQAEDAIASGDAKSARDGLTAALDLGQAIRRVEEIWARGLLARVHLALGELAAARSEAEQTLVLAAGTIPTAFYTLEGYAGMAEALLDERLSGAETDQAARRAVRALRRFAGVFPIASLRVAACSRMLTDARRPGRISAPSPPPIPPPSPPPAVDSMHER